MHAALLKCFLLPLRVLGQPRARDLDRVRAWKLLFLLPRLVLHRAAANNPEGRAALLRRTNDFLAGHWELLHQHSRTAISVPPPAAPTTEAAQSASRRHQQACAHVRAGNLSRARQTLTSSALAPGTPATFASLTDPTRRPPALRRPVPEHILPPAAPADLRLTAAEVVDSLRTAKRGAAPGLSGATVDHFKVLLDDEEGLHLLMHALSFIASADIPPEILPALTR